MAAFVAGTPAVAHAQAAASDPLPSAEQAYDSVDFDVASARARSALQRGGNDRRRLARIYRLLAFSRAGLNDAEGARAAFVRFLALEPDSRADRGLSPTMRAPLMEARGFWSEHREGMTLAVRRVRDGAAIEVLVNDPVGFVRTIVVESRIRNGAWTEVRRPVASRVVIDLPAGSVGQRVDYAVHADDEFGNQVLEHGTTDAPEGFAGIDVARGPTTSRASGGNGTLTGLGAVGVALGGGLLATGIVAMIVREGNASTWNDDTRCLNASMPQLSRADVCGGTLSSIHTAETLEAVGFIGAGVFGVAGAIALGAGASHGGSTQDHARRWGCGRGPGDVGLACSVSF